LRAALHNQVAQNEAQALHAKEGRIRAELTALNAEIAAAGRGHADAEARARRSTSETH
jgi:hypothetical protein